MATAKTSITATVKAEIELRFKNHTATRQDELVLALLEETMEQRKTICALNHKVAMLEMMDEPVCQSLEVAALVRRMSKSIQRTKLVEHED